MKDSRRPAADLERATAGGRGDDQALAALLAERERLLRTIIESEPECVKLLDADGCFRMMNRAGLKMIEADSIDQVRGVCLYASVLDEHRAQVQALTERVFRGETGTVQFQVRGFKGRLRWVETHAVPLRDDDGTVTALLGITRDITEHKLADAALRESERKYRILFEQATEGIFIADSQGRFLDVNPAGCEMFGRSRAEVLTMSIADMLAPGEEPRLAGHLSGLATRPQTSEWRLQRRDGMAMICEVTAKRLPDGRFQAFVRDVTARRRVEVALREGEDRLRRAVQAGRVGLWDWDLRSHTVYFSPEWKRQIGYEEQEIGNAWEEWRQRVHPEDLPAILERVEAFVAGSTEAYESEFRFRHKDGSYRRILAQASKVLDDDGRVARVLGSHVDITEHVELQERFLQAQKMESIGRLAGGIAHDFNNLLTVINGLADLTIADLRDSDPFRRDLEQIRLAGERAAVLTRQLLAISRQQVLAPEVLDLNQIVRDMENMLARLIGEDVTLRITAREPLSCVKADPGQIEQVILNLAVNARDAMPHGGALSIETRNVELDAAYAASHPASQPGPHVLLAVADTGLGMTDTVRQRVFEPFFTTKETGKGTGLGLSTVYGIVKQSGGSITVTSAPGAGTTFQIYLPRVPDQVRPPAVPAAVSAVRGSETVLLVEDERAVRELTRRVLQAVGYRVLEAASGGEALRLLERHEGRVDLMITDVVMPGMSGGELAARLAAQRPDMKVLFTSGYTDDAILRHGVLETSGRFIGKPFTPTELRRKVREVLDT